MPRTRLMPINKKYPLAVLMAALREPIRCRAGAASRIEYTLVAGKNDHLDEAKKVARLLAGLPVKINLIPMNPIEASTLGPPDMQGVFAFQRVLCDAGYSLASFAGAAVTTSAPRAASWRFSAQSPRCASSGNRDRPGIRRSGAWVVVENQRSRHDPVHPRP